MTRFSIALCFLLFAISVSAQNTDTGYSSNTGNSSSGSSSSFSDIGTAGTSAASDVDRFEGVGEMDFVGIRDGVPFVGREKPFETSRSSRTSSVRSSTTGTRRTTSARTTSARRTTAAGTRTSASASRDSVRSAATADFNYPQLNTDQRVTGFATQLKRTPNLPFDAEKIQVNVNPTVEGNTAVISGTVATEHSKKIAKQLLLLEPGIDRVENNITVVGK